MTTPPPMEVLTDLQINAEMQRMILDAYVPNDRPIVLGYVGLDGKPHLSWRGSVVPLTETSLGIWARNPEGGLGQSLSANPNVNLLYREPNGPSGFSRATMNFAGRAHIAEDEAERRQVYDAMPQRERDADKDYKGIAVVVDLDTITGAYPGYRLQMRR
ncbi:MAG: hypothetical protein AB7P33_14245 [Dehalococcoidia bacterium]